MTEHIDHLQISGVANPISALFSPVRQFTVEYYQREYAWTTTNVEELLNDLARSFLSNYSSTHLREQVASYNPYFLGPIVTYTSGAISYLVDGQQRVSTLSLLLLHLKSISTDAEQQSDLNNLVYSTSYGSKKFRMNVEARAEVMKAILEGATSVPEQVDSSSKNIWNRYQDISRLFPEELSGVALPFFIDWLQHRVILVEINTPDKNMALEIFESMNDRGLRLSNMDMLKSYLLSRIKSPERIEKADSIWKSFVVDLQDAQKNGDAEFMKTYLRAKYALTVRETGKGTSPRHFEDIATAFHKWVREQVEPTGNFDSPDRAPLRFESPEDFERFVAVELSIQARRYMQLLKVSQTHTPGWEHVYFNATNDFTLQYMLAMATSEVSDDDETFRQKVSLITKYIDLMIARRMANFKRRSYAMMYRPMFQLAKQVRGKSLEEIREIVAERAANLEESFDAIQSFNLNNMNKPDVYYLLARMTGWLENENTDRYFKSGSAKDPFEVEHVWANKFERHADEFASELEFLQARNQFGALLLLPKSFNASFGALPYAEKAPHYKMQNSLAQTLVNGLGKHNPNLAKKAEQLDEDFVGYPDRFAKADVKQRQALYRQMCEQIWDLESLGLIHAGDH
jgi:hypothetical protein